MKKISVTFAADDEFMKIFESMKQRSEFETIAQLVRASIVHYYWYLKVCEAFPEFKHEFLERRLRL